MKTEEQEKRKVNADVYSYLWRWPLDALHGSQKPQIASQVTSPVYGQIIADLCQKNRCKERYEEKDTVLTSLLRNVLLPDAKGPATRGIIPV